MTPHRPPPAELILIVALLYVAALLACIELAVSWPWPIVKAFMW